MKVFPVDLTFVAEVQGHGIPLPSDREDEAPSAEYATVYRGSYRHLGRPAEIC